MNSEMAYFVALINYVIGHSTIASFELVVPFLSLVFLSPFSLFYPKLRDRPILLFVFCYLPLFAPAVSLNKSLQVSPMVHLDSKGCFQQKIALFVPNIGIRFQLQSASDEGQQSNGDLF